MKKILRDSAVLRLAANVPKKGEKSEIQRQLATAFEETTDYVATIDAEGRALYINRAGRILLGIGNDEDISTIRIGDFFPEWACKAILSEGIPSAMRNGVWSTETALLSSDGKEIPVSQVILAHKTADGTVEFLSMIARDISELKNAENALQIFAKVFDSTQEGIMITDAGKRILTVNPAFSVVTGYNAGEITGKNPRILQSGRHNAEFYKGLWESLNNTGQWQGEIWNRRKNGEIYPEWLTISAIKNDKGEITNYVGIFSDITAIKLSENQLAHLAHHDALTGLPNRLLFYDRLKQALAQAHRNEQMVAIIFVDLDCFKPINDTLGHHIGDLLLQAVAGRLTSCVRECDTVARLGGDEFILILADIASRQDAAKVAQKVLNVLSQSFILEGHKLHISASIGISLYPLDGDDVDNLVRDADTAMYHAKDQGKNNYQFYSDM